MELIWEKNNSRKKNLEVVTQCSWRLHHVFQAIVKILKADLDMD